MIPEHIVRKAHDKLALMEEGKLTPRRLKHQHAGARVINITKYWRLVQVNPEGSWRIMSHQAYDCWANPRQRRK